MKCEFRTFFRPSLHTTSPPILYNYLWISKRLSFTLKSKIHPFDVDRTIKNSPKNERNPRPWGKKKGRRSLTRSRWNLAAHHSERPPRRQCNECPLGSPNPIQIHIIRKSRGPKKRNASLWRERPPYSSFREHTGGLP